MEKKYITRQELNFKHSKIRFSKLVFILFILLSANLALAQSQGPTYPVTGANVNGPGTQGWNNPGNIISNNGSYADTGLLSSNETSDYLRATNFGFAIPLTATVTGIAVEIERRSSSNTGGNSIKDVSVEMLKAGVLAGVNQADGTDWPTATNQVQTYGNTTDTWGTTWTPAEINAANFGVSLSVRAEGSSRTAYVDFIRVTVHYLLPPTLTTFSPTSACLGTSPTITINGTNFTNSSSVSFNGTASPTVTFISSTQLNATVPVGATTGPISVTTPAGTATSLTDFTILPLPVVDPITGTTTICPVGSTALSNATPGGVWSSSNNAVATVDAFGVVSGVTAGNATISYTITGGGCSNSATALVTVDPFPTLTAPATICLGSATQLLPSSGGTWISNNPSVATIDNAGNVSPVITGTVTFTFTNSLTTCSATTASITIIPAPSITVDPVAFQSVCSGASVSLSVTATGPGLTYQWYRGATALSNTGNVSGALTSTLTLNPVAVGDASTNYYVIVSGSCSPPATSSTAEINVVERVVITGQPTPTQTLCTGVAANFTVTATGDGLTYQWYDGATLLVDGGNISGATTSTLTLNPLLLTDASTLYHCVVSGTAPCSSVTSNNATLIVNESPIITSDPVATQTVCDDDPVSLSIVASGGSLSYQWYKGGTPLADGGNISGTNTDTLNFVPIHTADAAPNYYCVVTNACTSIPSTMAEVIVNLKPKIPAQTASVCSDLPFSVNPVNGVPNPTVIVPSGTNYAWSVPVVTGGITGGTAQSGQPAITDVLSNPTNTPQTATYTVIPTSGTAGFCIGDPFTVTVTVNPVPSVINLTPEICSGETLTITPTDGAGNIIPAGTTYSWGLPAVTGGLTGATVGSGVTSFSQTLVNPTSSPQNATYSITATSGSCVGSTFTIIVTVQPKPTAAVLLASQSICSGTAIAQIDFSNPNGVPGTVTYNWTRDNVATVAGIPASGSGPINGTLTTASSLPQTTTFTIQAYSDQGCISLPQTATVTVYATPTITPISNQIICSGASIANVTPVASVAGTTFSWTRTNANVSGIPDGSGTVISGNLTNLTNTPQTTTFTVTPILGGCTNLAGAVTFNVTVNPETSASALPTTQTVCGGAPFSITASEANGVTGTVFSFTKDSTVAGDAVSISGNTISGSLENNSGVDRVVTFTITASANGCSSTTTVTVTVQPNPAFTLTPATQNICTGASIATINLPAVPGVIYSWTRTNPLASGNLSGMPDSDTNVTSISGALTNLTTTNQTTVFTITATLNGCVKTRTVSVTVYTPMTDPVISETQTVCAGSRPTPLFMTTLPGGGSGTYTYQWQSSSSAAGPWTNVAGATGASYWAPTTNASTLTTFYQLVVSNPCGTVTSNAVSIAVANNLNFTFSISGGSTTICPGVAWNPTITSGQFLPDSYIRYSWTADVNYISPSTGGPILGTITYWPFPWLPLFVISSATLPLTTINNTGANVATTVYITPSIYDADTNAFICSLSPQAVNVTIRPMPVATITAPPAGTLICSATNAGVTVSSNMTGPFTITRSANANVTSSSTFPLTTASVAAGVPYTLNDTLTNLSSIGQSVTYTITPLANGCPGIPRTVVINIAPRLLPGSIGTNHTICVGGDPNLLTQTAVAFGAAGYSWESSIDGINWTLIAGANGITYDPPGPLTQNTWYRRVVSSSVSGILCEVAVTTPVLVTVNTLTAGTIGNDQTICSGGGPVTISSLSPGTGLATLSYQWQSNITGCADSFTNIVGATAATYTVPAGLTTTTYFRRLTRSTVGTCEIAGNCVTVYVNDVAGGMIGIDQALCNTTNPDLLTQTSPSSGSGILSYQWQSTTSATGCSGSSTWTNIGFATNTTYDPPAGVVATTWYRRVTTSTLNGVSCTANSNCVVVTANSVTAGAIGPNSRTVCSGGDPAGFNSLVAGTGTGLTYQWQSSPSGAAGTWTDISSATGANYDPPGPITATTYYQRVAIATVGASTCQATSNVVTVFVNDVTAPVIAGDQTVCNDDPVAFTVPTAATGSGVLTYQWQSSTTDCLGPWTNIGGATSAGYDPPISGQTTYYRVVVTSTVNGVLCTAISNCVTVISFAKLWTGTSNTDWNNPANWNPVGVPTSANCVIIPNVPQYAIISGSAYIGYCKNLTILNDGRLDINPSNSLVVTDNVMVNPSGNFFITNNASLVQINGIANIGTVVMQRITQPMYKFDYTYWNSPMVMGSYTLGNLSPNTQYDKYYSWNPTNGGGNGNWIQESVATVMDPTKGYIIRAPNSFSSNPAITQTYAATFTGTPNNGDIQIPIAIGTLGPATSNDKMNLIGNPYPSAVNAATFINDPANVSLIDGTIYFWTHHTPPSTAFPNPFYGNFIYNYSPAGYASWNTLGGTYTVPSGYGGTPPNGFIGAGQGFFVKGLGNGNAVFRNNMRVTGNNNVFFRPANPYASSPTMFESHRIWINMADTQGSFSQILVGYAEGATNDIDRGFDGETFNTNAISLYSIASEKILGIQGRALPFDHNDLVPLGYSSTVVRNFTIGIDRVDGLFDNQDIFLEDRQLNLIHDLKQQPYVFTAEVGTFNDRFVLRYTNSSLGVNHPETGIAVTAFIKSQKLHVRADEDISGIKIYDISGKLIKTYSPETSSFETDFNFAEGIYFAKISLGSGLTATAKLSNNK